MDQDRCYVRPVALERDPQGSSQIHPRPSKVSLRKQDVSAYHLPGPNNGLITCAQYDFLVEILQDEAGKHRDALGDLNAFRTYCFKLEQLLAIEQSKNLQHQATIHELQTRCQEREIRARKAELRMWELQRLNDSLSSALIGADLNLDAVRHVIAAQEKMLTQLDSLSRDSRL